MNKLFQRGFTSTLVLFLCLATTVGGATGCRWLPRYQCSTDTPLDSEQVHHPVNVLVSQHYFRLRPRRVVITTPLSQATLLPEQKKFATALVDSLKHAGFSNAVLAQPCRCDTQMIRKGKIDLQQLVNLSNEYSADAVLYCDVDSFSAYSPIQASVSLTLVDAREAVTLMAVDGSWSLRDAPIQAAFLRHLGSYRGDTDYKNKIKYQSPTEFLNFVSRDLAHFMSLQ